MIAGMIHGLRICVSPDTPKMQLSPDLPVTDEFRAEFNDWMRAFFGTTNLVGDGEALVSHATRTIMVNPRMYERMVSITGSKEGGAA